MFNNTNLLPEHFIEKVKTFIPSHLSISEFIDYCHRPLRKSIRVNTLKISVTDFIKRMQAQGWRLTPVPWCDTGFWLERPEEQESNVPLGNTFEHMAGLFYIQEASSMLPPVALRKGLENAEMVLDIAAAPGSKTTQLAAFMENEGLILANEFSSTRLKGLHSNILRCGIKNVSMTHFDGRIFADLLPETFDAVLLDTPCGGEGTVRKDKGAMLNWSQLAVDELSVLQKELVESAFKALKPEGVLVYSTCTLSPEENHHVCAHLLHEFRECAEIMPLGQLFDDADQCCTEEGYLHVWPQIYDSEGFFVACFKKTKSLDLPLKTKRVGKFPFEPVNKKIFRELSNYLEQHFAFTLPQSANVYQRDKELWWFPQDQPNLIGKIKCDRMGLKVAEIFTKGKQLGFRCTHEFIVAVGEQFIENTYELSEEQLKTFYQGKNIALDVKAGKSGEVVLKFDGFAVGCGKWLGNQIKNSLPREMVRDDRLIR